MSSYVYVMRPKLLVAIQFIAIGMLIYGSVRGQIALFESLLIFFGALIGISGIRSMKLDNFRIMPLPRSDAKLITSGIYSYIRHPMYTGLLLLGLGLALSSESFTIKAFWLVLLIDLLYKLRYEEILLNKKFTDYRDYSTRTKRLIPFIW